MFVAILAFAGASSLSATQHMSDSIGEGEQLDIYSNIVYIQLEKLLYVQYIYYL